MRHALISAVAMALAGCASTSPHIRESLPAAEGTAVSLGTAVQVGKLAVEPVRIVEDSRCPINARCVWAGRLIVEVNIAEEGWTEINNLTMGEAYTVRGVTITLTDASPQPTTGSQIESEDYRLTFEASQSSARD